jgi:hypothetical protein
MTDQDSTCPAADATRRKLRREGDLIVLGLPKDLDDKVGLGDLLAWLQL